MHARIATSLALVVLAVATPAGADTAQTDVRAELAPNGDTVRLVVTSGGKQPGAKLAIGKAKPVAIHAGEAIGTLKTGHGRTVVALAADDENAPFRIHVLAGADPGKATTIARPAKRHDVPFAVVMTPTPEGFTVFFQEVEAANANEAHTYMVELDKEGKVSEKAREIAVPWWIGDAIWNGNGYHLALFYAGEMMGARLSMVSLDRTGRPEQHPDWASQPGAISDVHLVAEGGRIRAFYRGGAGDRLFETDVTKIGQWGNVTNKAKDHGALAANMTIAITAKGTATKIKAQ